MTTLHLLDNKEIIDLFEIKLNDYEGYFRFHGSKNFSADVVFAGLSYIYLPCELSNLQYESDGQQSRPTFSVSNVNNFMSDLLDGRSDLLGKELFRKKILAKDLDDVNFGGANRNTLGNKFSNNFIHVDSFIIHKKMSHSKDKVEFEIANVLDVDGITCPRRKVYNDSCQWQYRGCGCNYGKLLDYKGPFLFTAAHKYKSLNDIIGQYEIFSGLGSNLILWLDAVDAESLGEGEYLGPIYSLEQIVDKNNYLIGYKRVIDSDSKYLGYYKLDSNLSNKAGQSINQGGSNLISDNDITLSGPLNVERGAIGFFPQRKFLTGTNTSSNRPASYLKVTKQFSNNYTIFCVAYNMDTFTSQDQPYINRSLLTSSGNHNDFMLGISDDGYTPFCKINNKVVYTSYKSSHLSRATNVYSVSVDSSNEATFYFNGCKVSQRVNVGANTFQDVGINICSNTSKHSEIGFYELIIFDTALTDDQNIIIHSYLAFMYNIQSQNNFIASDQMSSDYIFSLSNQPNLGVPVADENDKTFMALSDFDSRSENNYGISSLSYKGDYDEDVLYKKGDFVKLDPELNYDFNQNFVYKTEKQPIRFFVFVSEEAQKGVHPLLNTSIWVEDKCSKKLSGCKMRFNGGVRIPFGGFPGTVNYDYKLPND